MTMMVTTGLASKFSQFLTVVSHGHLFFALLFTAVFSLILGMGVPPVATYVLTSALTASAIQKLAMSAGIPENAALLATHMFLFYYAVLAEVTPPVGLSVYAASSVFETNPIETGIYSALEALPKYLIGLSFICSYFGTATLIIPIIENYHGILSVGIIALRFALTVIAIVFLTAGSTGFLRSNLSKPERTIMIICGILLFYPHLYFDIIVLIPGTFIYFKKRFEKKN
jgi:TRAP-type uncharacterized transport system fused permease subunit